MIPLCVSTYQFNLFGFGQLIRLNVRGNGYLRVELCAHSALDGMTSVRDVHFVFMMGSCGEMRFQFKLNILWMGI